MRNSDEYSANPSSPAKDDTRDKYAGMGRDENGLDHTPWRKYESWNGRWTSPDPYTGSMNAGDPQSLNRYSYVRNDPVNFVDPSGLLRIQQCTRDWHIDINGNKVYTSSVCWVIYDDGGGDSGSANSPQQATQQPPKEEMYHCIKEVQDQLKAMNTALQASGGTKEYGFMVGLDVNTGKVRIGEMVTANQREHVTSPPIPGTINLAMFHSHDGGALHSQKDMTNAVLGKFTSYVLPQKWGIPGLTLYNGLASTKDRKIKAAPVCPKEK